MNRVIILILSSLLILGSCGENTIIQTVMKAKI